MAWWPQVALATSATDLIVPIGFVLWIVFSNFAIFFIFLWKGGSAGKGVSFSSILGLVMAILSLAFGVTPQPILWIYDNQTTTFITAYMVPQAQAVDLYYILFVSEIFLVISACFKMMFETELLTGQGEEDDY